LEMANEEEVTTVGTDHIEEAVFINDEAEAAAAAGPVDEALER
jgi:hypothetical protein